MKQTVTLTMFKDAFISIRPNNFSYIGLEALFDHFEQIELETGDCIELDVIAICCDYTEYENLEAFQDDYNAEDYPDIDTIKDFTTVIEIDGSDGFIVMNF